MSAMKVLQKIAYEWGVRCFGAEHMGSFGIRALRLAEEAVELAQACDVPKHKLIDLINIVYERKPGKKRQELGGVLVTTMVLCELLGEYAEELAETEVQRCLRKPPEHFAARNLEKIKLGLDVAT